MNNFISLDQYRSLIKRNILQEPKMLVSNQTHPISQIFFQCPGDNYQMKDIVIPAGRNAVDLTQQAPLENLLACSQLKALIQTQHILLLNPEEMPEPTNNVLPPVLSSDLVAGAVSVDGMTSPNATVIIEQNGNVWAGTSSGSGLFNVNVSGLEQGTISITVTADGYTPARYTYAVAASPLQPMPAPTVHAVFKETTVTGTTVANANISLSVQSKTFTGQADDQGAFSVDVDPLPYDTIHMIVTAEGYIDNVTSHVVDTIPGLAYIESSLFLVPNVSGRASPNAEVEILIEGQSNQFVTADAAGNWEAAVEPVKGAISIRVLETGGYDEATATVQPILLPALVMYVDNADSIGEKQTTFSGTIPGLNPAATDVAITLTVQAGLYEGTVQLPEGTWEISGVDATSGVNSIGVVTLTSQFYNDASVTFDILEEFTSPDIQAVSDGDTSITGLTQASTLVEITVGGETFSTSSSPQGLFTVGGFTRLVPGTISINLSRSGYLTAAFDKELQVRASLQLDSDLLESETQVTGTATAGATVTLTQGDVVGDAIADATTGIFSITLSGELVAGTPATILVRHSAYLDYEESFVVEAL